MAIEHRPEIVESGGKTYEMVRQVYGKEVPGIILEVVVDTATVLLKLHPEFEETSGFIKQAELSLPGSFVEAGQTLGALRSLKSASQKVRLCPTPARASRGHKNVGVNHRHEGWPLALGYELRLEPERWQFFIASTIKP